MPTAPTPSGNGSRRLRRGIVSFGDAGFLGSTGAVALARPVVGIGMLRR